MGWQTLRKIYFEFFGSSHQVQMLTAIGYISFQDFPKNMPPRVNEYMQEFNIKFAPLIAEAGKNSGDKNDFTIDLEGPEGQLFTSIIMLYMSESLSGNHGDDVGIAISTKFSRLLGAQAIIMLYAYMDAFLADTLREICRKQPNMLKRDKKIDWSTALDFDTKDELIEYLTERFVYDFGWKSIAERIEFLSNQLGIPITISDDDLDLLEQGEYIRHIAVHNGSKVSSEFIERTGNTNLEIGEYYPVTLELIEKLTNLAELLAGDIFISVSKKYYNISDDELTGIMRRRADDA